MRGFSKAIIAGNLTRDPEMRTTGTGKNVCSFSVAVNYVFKNASGENQEKVSYLNCVCWGKPGEVINQYFKKGSPILVSGRLEQRSWDDKKTGEKRSAVEINVEDFNFLSSGNGSGQGSYSGGAKSSSGEPVVEEVSDDLPSDEIDLSEIPF